VITKFVQFKEKENDFVIFDKGMILEFGGIGRIDSVKDELPVEGKHLKYKPTL